MDCKTTQLYHCTNYSALCNILKSKQFNPSFCLEELSIYPNESMKMAYAVVCFADLLKQELKMHMLKFHSDSYMIMDKKWARKNNVSPVIYYTDYSLLSVLLKNILEHAAITNKNENENNLKFYNSVSLFMGFLKQYEGRYFIKDKNIFSDITQFYKEREWRYLPMPKDYEAFYITEDDYKNKTIRKEKTEELITNGYSLKFELNDIIEIGVPLYAREALKETVIKAFNKQEQKITMQKVRYLSSFSERIKSFFSFNL